MIVKDRKINSSIKIILNSMMYKAVIRSSPRLLCCTKVMAPIKLDSCQVASVSPVSNSRKGPIRIAGIMRSVKHKNSPTTSKKSIDEIVMPVQLDYNDKKNETANTSIGEELTGAKLTDDMKQDLLSIFLKRPEIRQLCEQKGLGSKLFNQAFLSFRRFCLETDPLPVELHILLYDLSHGQGHIDDLFPHFMSHALKIYPHLECLDDLKKISDLRLPHTWYPEARLLKREIIFHAGPTNSGKTYQALKSFMEAETGVYCGPLKMLAVEVFHKTNDAGVECDLVTGEERRYASSDQEPASHLACTVEMLNTSQVFDVAIIDEIQMVRDQTRGWAWTRALLGVNARQVHVCGEMAALEIVKQLVADVQEEVKVFEYKRINALQLLDRPLGSLGNIRDGDCIVAFSKNDIYAASRQIEKMGREVALIYGSLPPKTKLDQAKKFNDPDHPCKVMVATDAIGMGLNLAIKRVIFWSLVKPTLNEYGEIEKEYITTSTALQIGGRAGRFGAGHDVGEVTTYRSQDLAILKQIFAQTIENIEKAGLHPTVEQIEMFSYYLPRATLTNLVDIFVTLCSVDESKFFMCLLDDFKSLATQIEHVPHLNLRTRYVFCLAPVNTRATYVCQMFVKMARKFSTAQPLSWAWLEQSIEWNLHFRKPQRLADLVLLEMIFDVLDLYLWLSYRFPGSFVDVDLVRKHQHLLDKLMCDSMSDITFLLTGKTDKAPTVNVDDAPKEEEVAAAPAQPVIIEAQPERKAAIADKLYNMAMDGKVEKAPVFNISKLKVIGASKFAGRDGFLTKRLLDKGLLTPSMLSKLQEEWILAGTAEPSDSDQNEDPNSANSKSSSDIGLKSVFVNKNAKILTTTSKDKVSKKKKR